NWPEPVLLPNSYYSLLFHWGMENNNIIPFFEKGGCQENNTPIKPGINNEFCLAASSVNYFTGFPTNENDLETKTYEIKSPTCTFILKKDVANCKALFKAST